MFFKPLNVSVSDGCKRISWVPLSPQQVKSLGLLPVVSFGSSWSWLISSMDWFQRRWLSRLLFWNGSLQIRNCLYFFSFPARQVSGTCRRFLVAHMYSALENPTYPELWPCFWLLSLKAAQSGLVIPWGCGAAPADVHRLCLWVWKDSSPFPYLGGWEKGRGSHFSDWANRNLQQNECYPPNAVPEQVLNHSAFYTRRKF